MNSTFSLKVLASDKVFYDGKCCDLILPTIDGEKEFLAKHENTVMIICNGNMRFQTEDGTWIKAVVGMGSVEMINNRMTILVDSVERPEDIDEVRAKEAKYRAEEQLRQKQSMHEYNHSKASLARAMSRLNSKNRYNQIGL